MKYSSGISLKGDIKMMLYKNMPQAGLMRLPEVLKYIPVSKSTFWAGVKSGRFPAPIKLTARTTAWRVRDILDFIEQLGQGGNV
jgi:predicted DNA-binding transcriptional regulator AlpA